MSGFTQEAMRVFANATNSPTHMIKGDKPINFAGFNTYVGGDMAARKMSTFGGEKWDYRYQAAEGNHLKQVNPGGLRTLSRTDNVEEMSQLGVLHYQDFAVVDREIEANEGLDALASVGAWEQWYDRVFSVRAAKKQEAAVTIINDIERMLFAVPVFNTMENRSNKPTAITPLTAFINEWYLGCHGITTATGFTAGSGGTDFNTAVVTTNGWGRWSTKQSVSVNQTKNVVNGKNIFACQQVGYTTLDVATTSFFNAMLRAKRLASFQKPPQFPNVAPSGIETASANMAKVWYTSDKGMSVIESATLATQDRWVTPSRVDPAVYSPQVGGIPIEWVTLLDTYAGYAGSSNTTLVTEGQGDAKGPRFLLHDRDALTIVAHKLNWFRERKASGNQLIPDLNGEYLDVEFNLGAVDFRTSACVFPSSTPSGISAY